MPENKDHLWKVAEEAQDKIENLVSGSNPVGLDVGTSKLVAARKSGNQIQSAAQLNAFIPVAFSPFTEKTIQQQSDITYFRDGDELVIYGTATERFANMFNAEVRRPMADGVMNARERSAMPVLEAILQTLNSHRAFYPSCQRKVYKFSVDRGTIQCEDCRIRESGV
jgi:6,7-dimethyl-8-ribityllumazine synthase